MGRKYKSPEGTGDVCNVQSSQGSQRSSVEKFRKADEQARIGILMGGVHEDYELLLSIKPEHKETFVERYEKVKQYSRNIDENKLISERNWFKNKVIGVFITNIREQCSLLENIRVSEETMENVIEDRSKYNERIKFLLTRAENASKKPSEITKYVLATIYEELKDKIQAIRQSEKQYSPALSTIAEESSGHSELS